MRYLTPTRVDAVMPLYALSNFHIFSDPSATYFLGTIHGSNTKLEIMANTYDLKKWTFRNQL